MDEQCLYFMDLPPEIFPVIASHFPLFATPRALLSLTLTSHQAYSIFYPLLYSRLILRNEKDALSIINTLLNNPEKSKLVRQLHIRSELSREVRQDPNRLDVLRALEKLVNTGALSLIDTLEVRLKGHSWFCDEKWTYFPGFGELRAPFWAVLKEKCPRLRSLAITNIGELPRDRWITESGIFDMENIIDLTFRLGTLGLPDTQQLWNHVSALSSGLRRLNLCPASEAHDWMWLTPLLELTFPVLESLTLYNIHAENVGSERILSFFERHPKIESLDIHYFTGPVWFRVEDVERITGAGYFLPRLKHLTASFLDARGLVPLLPQLRALTILNSINAQVPYLLRSIIPSGLPNLKSLTILQSIYIGGSEEDEEGDLWYEDSEGKFCTPAEGEEQRNFGVDLLDKYMHSIVKAVPNVEELSLIGRDIRTLTYHTLLPDLAHLPHLRRFVYENWDHTLNNMGDPQRELFKSQARLAAEHCLALEEVVDIKDGPPTTARIVRDFKLEEGQGRKVVDVKIVNGDAMVTGKEYQAFPTSIYHNRSTY